MQSWRRNSENCQGPLACTVVEERRLLLKSPKPPRAAQLHSGTMPSMDGTSDPANIGTGEEACAIEENGLLKVGKATGSHMYLTDPCGSFQSCLLTLL